MIFAAAAYRHAALTLRAYLITLIFVAAIDAYDSYVFRYSLPFDMLMLH